MVPRSDFYDLFISKYGNLICAYENSLKGTHGIDSMKILFIIFTKNINSLVEVYI